MSDSNLYYVKQVWRQKGDALFEHIPFKEANKAQELSQTTRPVLLLETKASGGSNAVFAIGRVEPSVVEQAIDYPSGEHLYHVPFTYEVVLEDKSQGLTREELQELAGQKFAPQVKGGLYAIEESVFEQVAAILRERAGSQAPTVSKAAETAKKTEKKAAAPVNGLLEELANAHQQLLANGGLRVTIEEGKIATYPAALLGGDDLVAVQENITQYVASGRTDLDLAAQEVAATAALSSPRYANVIGLVLSLLREGKYESVQSPTLQKAFYRGGRLPHPYLAIELQGKQGHHVLGIDGTLYTADGQKVQHFLGL